MMKCFKVCCAVLFVSAISIAAMGSEEQKLGATDYKSFYKIEWYYDSDNHSIIVYLSTASSSLVFSNIYVKVRKEKSKTVYEFTVLSSYGGEKTGAKFKQCVDRGYLVNFPVKNFRSRSDKVVYFEEPNVEHEIPFCGGWKEALLNHKLLPHDWRPPPIKGIPGISEEK